MPEQEREVNVLFEDEFLLVLEKPAGMVVNNSNSTRGVTTLQDLLQKNYTYPLSRSCEYRSGIVHRLDKDTSGLLLVAKKKEVFIALQTSFKKKEVEKTYLTLVHKLLKEKEGEITAPVGRLPWNRRRFGVLPGGREATTLYEVLDYYKSSLGDFTLLKIKPKTGRTHQIRIHLKYLGYPIVSDSFYAGRKTSRDDRVWCPRLFLHASEIVFKHPTTGKKMTLSSPLPNDLVEALKRLKVEV